MRRETISRRIRDCVKDIASLCAFSCCVASVTIESGQFHVECEKLFLTLLEKETNMFVYYIVAHYLDQSAQLKGI